MPEIEQWRDDTLDLDRNTEQLERKQRQKDAPFLGDHRVTWQLMQDEEYPLNVYKILPPELISKLTQDEGADLAGHISYGTATVMKELLKKWNEGDSLPRTAPDVYWNRLMEGVVEDDELGDQLSHAWNAIAWGWCSRRFNKGADRAALCAHWDVTLEDAQRWEKETDKPNKRKSNG